MGEVSHSSDYAECAQITAEDLVALDSLQLEKQLRAHPKFFADALADALHRERLTPKQLCQILFGDHVAGTPSAIPSLGPSQEARADRVDLAEVAPVHAPAEAWPRPPLRILVYVAGKQSVGKTMLIEKWCRLDLGQAVLITVSAFLAEDGSLNVNFQNLNGDAVLSCKYDEAKALDSMWMMIGEKFNSKKSDIKLVLSDGTLIRNDRMLKTYFECVHEERKYVASSKPAVPTAFFECSTPEGLSVEFEFHELPSQGSQKKLQAGTIPSAVIFVFSYTDRGSYDVIPGWRRALGCADMPILLVGNKAEVSRDGRELGAKDVTWHRRYGWEYFDVSAESGFNLLRPLQWAARKATADTRLEFSHVQK